MIVIAWIAALIIGYLAFYLANQVGRGLLEGTAISGILGPVWFVGSCYAGWTVGRSLFGWIA